VKIRIAVQEDWPVYVPRSKDDHYAETLVDVHKGTVDRWKRVIREYGQVQGEMQKVYEEHGGTAR
jgi:hypothetical protein